MKHLDMSRVSVLLTGFFMILLILAAPASAATYTYTKDGNQVSSSSGSYATSTHCAGTACTWISGNQVIVGTYSGSLDGGSVCYSLTGVQSTSVSSASLKVEWPAVYGKGLHARATTGKGSITVNGNTVASISTNYGTCSPTNDYYGHACNAWSLTYTVTPSFLSSATNVCITTTNNAIWDISKMTLTVNAQDPAPTCSSAISCSQTYVSGSTTYYCRNFGSGYQWYTASQGAAFCDSSAEVGKRAYCGSTEYICSDLLRWNACTAAQACSTAVPAKGVTYYCRNFNSAGWKWTPCAKCNSIGCSGVSGAVNFAIGTTAKCSATSLSCTSAGWR